MLTRPLVSGKFNLIPNREPVTVSLARPGNSSAEVAIQNAWRKPVKLDRLISLGMAIGTHVEEFHIPDAELNPGNDGREIRPSNDTITDAAGNVFVVLSAQLKTVRTVWVCLAQAQKAGAV